MQNHRRPTPFQLSPGLAAVIATLLLTVSFESAHAGVVFETALGDGPLTQGYTIGGPSGQQIGARFTLTEPTLVHTVGAFVSPTTPGVGTLFAEIVPVVGQPALPPLGPVSIVPLAYQSFAVPVAAGDVEVPMTIALAPGNYALVIGSEGGMGEVFAALPNQNTGFPGFLPMFYGVQAGDEWGDGLTHPARLFALSDCGDFVLDDGEQCDDGDTAVGDGCNSQCQEEVCGNGVQDAGEECDDGNSSQIDCCANDCTLPSPAGCNAAGSSSLLVIDDPDSEDKDKLVWKWKKGGAAELSDFGMPATATSYRLCIDRSSPAAGSLGDFPMAPTAAWSGGAKNWKLKAPASLESLSGMLSATLKPGAAGKSGISFKGGGEALPALTIAAGDTLSVTLRSDHGFCWTSGALVADKVKGKKALAKTPKN